MRESKHRLRQARQGASLGSSRWAQILAVGIVVLVGLVVIATIALASG
jgi:hypothetical protein